MKTFQLAPAIGQRYLYRQPGASDKFWVVTAMGQVRTVLDSPEVRLFEELTHHAFNLSLPAFVQKILDGTLRPSQPELHDAGKPPIALSDLFDCMSQKQVRRFKMRVSYVFALHRAQVGLSPKSPQFAECILANHRERFASWQLRIAKDGVGQSDNVEMKAPAPTSVYRWFKRYRKSNCDTLVLAQEFLARHTRKKRKPLEAELLPPFLSSQLATVGSKSIRYLTEEFNDFLAKHDALHIDDVIDALFLEKNEKREQNWAARRGKSSMRKPKKAQNDIRPHSGGALQTRTMVGENN